MAWPKIHPANNPVNRSRMLRRSIGIIIEISNRGRSMRQLAKEFDVTYRTIARDIDALQAIGVPVYDEFEFDDLNVRWKVWKLDRDWANQFMKNSGNKTGG